jgi:hypothetical protein
LTKDNWLNPERVHSIVEKQALEFLNFIGIDAKKVKEEPYCKTPDYAVENMAIEVTTVHDYDPPSQDSLKQFLGDNPGNYYLSYGYTENRDTNPKQEIILRRRFNWDYSVLHSMQHVSYYRKKFIGEIEKKSQQAHAYDKEIIVLDLRTAPFKAYSLINEIYNILNLIGEQYTSLLGLMVSTRRNDLSEIEDVHYFFIRNEHSIYHLLEIQEAGRPILDSVNFDLIERVDALKYEDSFIVPPAEVMLDLAEIAESEIRRRGLAI